MRCVLRKNPDIFRTMDAICSWDKILMVGVLSFNQIIKYIFIYKMVLRKTLV